MQERSYNVGDLVVVRADLREGSRYGSMTAVCPMGTKAGEIVEITSYHPALVDAYRINSSRWWWTDSMFVGRADDVMNEDPGDMRELLNLVDVRVR